MNEMKKTILFGGVALGLALLAFVTAPKPATPDAFFDLGEEFYPEFNDPNAATSLEVVRFDEESGEAIPFKVVFANGKWSIPSHYDYPADGKDHLSKTAASVIGVKKDDFRTDNPNDYEACGVIDPLNESATSLTGRGERITIKSGESILADYIVGKKVEDRDGFRFVRLPDEKRVYAARMNIELSTKFSDWIEADLLQVERSNIQQITLKDYSINERSGSVRQGDVLTLTRDGSNWQANRMRSSEEVDAGKMNDLVKNIDELSIVGVRPKPPGLSSSLKKEGAGVEIAQSDMLSLQDKGFYFSRDGQLLSNEGEMEVRAGDGVIYTLRFGEVAFGTGLDVSAGGQAEGGSDQAAENRYLFITTAFDDKKFDRPREPSNTEFLSKPDSLLSDADRSNKVLHDAYTAWQSKVEQGKSRAAELNDRFANWYYVISSESFDKLNLDRSTLIKKKS